MNDVKKKSRRKKIIRIAVIVAVVALVLTAVILILKRQVTKRYGAEASGDIQSATATVGNVNATVSGSGNLADMDVEALELSSTVEIKKLYVNVGDTVSDGTLLADVEMFSIISAMNKLQAQIEALDNDISAAASETVSSYITSPVSGRIKDVCVESGTDVAAAMYEHGALVKISLDGYMAVDIARGGLAAGESLSLQCADGTVYDAVADSCDGSEATVLVTDDGPVDGETVTVFSADGKALGTGELYIHQSLSVTGYTGTISGVYAKENNRVYSGSTLLYLTDTDYSGNYDALLKERGELEEQLSLLISIYKEGALYAHESGSISSVTDVDNASADGETMQTIMSVCPDKTMTVSVSVDESDILSLSVGQTAAVTVDSLGSDEYEGTVTEIETTGTASNGVTYYKVTVTLDKVRNMLSGMTASVVIKIEGVDGALIIPSDALIQTSTASFVYTSVDETTGELGSMKEVTAGLNNGSYVEITGGLSEGDVVYYTPKQEQTFSFGGFGGGMPSGSMPGGSMPSGSMPGGGERPSGSMSGGMPSFGN